MFTHFNNSSIRKLVIAFGGLFNNIKLEQTNENGATRTFTVPLSYGAKEKFVKRLTEPSSISDKTRIEVSLPRMSFDLLQLGYDPIRKLNKLNIKKENTTTIYPGTMYSEVPYNFIFGLYVYTRNIEENLQIMEQILPYFSPEFLIHLKMNSLNESVSVPISIGNTTLGQEYEGDFSTRRFIVSSYQFTAKSFVYGKIDQTRPQVTDYSFNFDGYNINGITFISELGLTG